MNCIFYLTLLALISVICWSCPYDMCKEHMDYGSCGNACCKLGFTLASSTVEAMVKLNGTIVRGGPDKQYTAQMTAEGTLGFADLREFGVGVDFIGQAFHVTDSGEYTDTINFTLIPGGFGKRGSRLIVFSISQIGGAYVDNGQNYYNIMNLVSSIFRGADPVHMDDSCYRSSLSRRRQL